MSYHDIFNKPYPFDPNHDPSAFRAFSLAAIQNGRNNFSSPYLEQAYLDHAEPRMKIDDRDSGFNILTMRVCDLENDLKAQDIIVQRFGFACLEGVLRSAQRMKNNNGTLSFRQQRILRNARSRAYSASEPLLIVCTVG